MELFSLPLIDSDLTGWFILDGQEYEISQFSISFSQSVDPKGQPQDETRGGRMLVGLTTSLPESIYHWAMSSNPKNGEVVFRSKTTSAPLRVLFMNAYCVNFERLIDAGIGIQSELLISPDEIIINGISFDNHWV
ncbi:type VI secretion system tube protein TssD [uncultured Bacteroides sp.]|uniref:type VI secretion system tube protein TssD n=1 Tax=uncultured Bacteroides sp. TaxID=162156 RepID=UPI0025F16F92|nr:type VI secretion system tube protein TssD [uncultured Bacteroides sp.]